MLVFVKPVSLVVLTLQAASLSLMIRYIRTRDGDMFLSSTAIILMELVKMLTCLVILLIQEKSFQRWLLCLHTNLLLDPWDWLKISVISVIYIIQNNLIYVAISHLDAATYQVTFQLKILTTALFSVIILGKKLSIQQWVSLILLFIGVSIVQLNCQKEGTSNRTMDKPLLGLAAVVICSSLSGFAGVYFEKILKKSEKSIWLRNIQLSVIGSFTGTISLLITDGKEVQEKGFFFGYDWVVFIIIFLQALGGLMVAITVKYADNILKCFATTAAILLSCLVSMYLFDFVLTGQFAFGTSLVILAVYIYTKYAHIPQKTKSQERKHANNDIINNGINVKLVNKDD